MVQDTLSLDEQSVGGRNKYNAKRTTVDGITFDSKAESARYIELALMELSGEIARLELQPEFVLQPAFTYRGKKERAIVYRADFRYLRLSDGVTVIEDVKGQRTDAYKLKRKLLLAKLAQDSEAIEFIEVGSGRHHKRR